MILFKGYKHKGGIVHFRDITWDDLRAVFLPKTFQEKYMYLGCVPFDDEGSIFRALEPLVIFMDYRAKRWWCPRWVLRFLFLFGMDKSIVRVRNHWMATLLSTLTYGYRLVDYKTKWEWYDLRISIYGDDQMYELSDGIEEHYYQTGKHKDEQENGTKTEPL